VIEKGLHISGLFAPCAVGAEREGLLVSWRRAIEVRARWRAPWELPLQAVRSGGLLRTVHDRRNTYAMNSFNICFCWAGYPESESSFWSPI
jgi:hypothetical protein